MTALEMWLVLTVAFNPRGYFLPFNLFELVNRKLFGLFHVYDIDYFLLFCKDLYVPSAAVSLSEAPEPSCDVQNGLKCLWRVFLCYISDLL